MSRLLIIPFLLFCLFLVACGGKTTGASNITHSSATLNYEGHCDPGDNGYWFAEVRQKSGPGAWVRWGNHTIPTGCSEGSDGIANNGDEQRLPATGESPLSDNVTGLTASTTYQYRVGIHFNNGQEAFTDSTGTTNGTSYTEFTTNAVPSSGNILGVNFSNVSSTVPSSVTSEADQSATPAIGDQDSSHDTKTLAAALIYAKTGSSTRLSQVCTALSAIQGTETSGPFGSYTYARALAVGRGVQAYAIAASLVDSANCSSESSFRTWLSGIRDFTTQGGPASLRECASERPNNWGTHCRASMLAADIYLGDNTDKAQQVTQFKGWVGDRTAYTGYNYGALDWQANQSAPVGINPPNTTLSGISVDGVLPDDQRRCSCSPPTLADENYVYEGLQGALVEGILLEAAGYDGLGYSTQAIKRAFAWENNVNSYYASGDDGWMVPLVNRAYGTSYTGGSDSFGKGFGAGAWLAPGLPVQ